MVMTIMMKITARNFQIKEFETLHRLLGRRNLCRLALDERYLDNKTLRTEMLNVINRTNHNKEDEKRHIGGNKEVNEKTRAILRTLSSICDRAYLTRKINLFSLTIFTKKAESQMFCKALNASHRTSLLTVIMNLRYI